MPFDPDDPRLTAYALGELDADGREAVEAILRDDPDGRALVLGIEQTAALLTEELRIESTATAGLDPVRLSTIEGRLDAPATLALPKAPPRRSLLIPMAAAAGLLGVGATIYLISASQEPRVGGRWGLPEAEYAHAAAPPAEALAEAGRAASGPVAKNTAPYGDLGRRDNALGNAQASPAPPASATASAPQPPAATPPMLSYVAPINPSPPAARPSTQGRGLATGQGSDKDRESQAKLQGRLDQSGSFSRKTDTARVEPQALGAMGGMGGAGGMGGGMAAGRAQAPARREDRVRLYADPFDSLKVVDNPSAGKRKSTSAAPDPNAALLSKDKLPAVVPGQQGQGAAGYGMSGMGGRPGQQAQGDPSKPQSQGQAPSQDQGQKNGGEQGQKAGALAAGSPPQADKSKSDIAERFAAPEPLPGLAPAPAEEAAKRLGDALDADVSGKKTELAQIQRQVDDSRRALAQEQTRVDREAYARVYDNPFQAVVGHELSTFAVDVDTASYANVRRFLDQGQLPPVDAVRIEEMVNYFAYDDPAPKGDEPFSVNVEVAACPWDPAHRLARIGLKGRAIDADKRPSSSLVFLIDVSGSMADLNKLPLLKAGMKLLVDRLGENDRVGIVVYANNARVVFPSTPCHDRKPIRAAIDALQAGGGTNGGEGIRLAYEMAQQHFIRGGTNRVILATDGDFNVGISTTDLLAMSALRAKSNIFLSVLGFGQGNIQEGFMEQLADKGNGHFAYIDTIDEARKVLVRELAGTLVTIAKDVKIQVEFNPARVASYRLIGYENRVMPSVDFRDDAKDAGEIGAGHSVTALYEIVPAAPAADVAAADRPLKYRNRAVVQNAVGLGIDASPETMTVYLRHKKPEGDRATEISKGVVDDNRDFGRASADLKFAAAVAGFGMLLRESPHRGTLTLPAVLEVASSALGDDRDGDRKGFLDLVRKAEQVRGPTPPIAP